MDQFFKYFYEDIGRVINAFLEVITAFFNFLNYLLNFPMRMEIIESYSDSFSTKEKIMLFVVNLLLIGIIVILFRIIGLAIKKIFRFRVSGKKYDALVKQVQNLQRDLIRANYEKDKLLALKVAELGLSPDQVDQDALLNALYDADETEKTEENAEETKVTAGERNTFESPCVDATKSRFFRLTSVDNYYKKEYVMPDYPDVVKLDEFCAQFRNYAASELGLYYDLKLMRHFVASLGAARIIILQGISGTGKTSLPYAFGKFVQRDTTVVSVQPAWRERTELYGYFNEFTKQYTETDFLRAVYEANYFKDPHIVILDEMNIARVEYYFAEMLSILEMPRSEEWKIDIVTATWDNDPCLIHSGKVQIPDNLWFVGTINNDDSTFAVADKVYDRAIPIDLDNRAEAFECEKAEPIYVTSSHLVALFEEAKQRYEVSEETLEQLEEVNDYLYKHFHLIFGNRIMKQLKDYVPCYVACGGTELEAVDFMMAKKVLRKFESLNLGFMKDELTKFDQYLDKTFGKDVMAECKKYIDLLKRNN